MMANNRETSNHKPEEARSFLKQREIYSERSEKTSGCHK